MAILTSTSQNMLCEISPIKPKNGNNRWIETRLSLELKVMEQIIAITPWRYITMMYQDFTLFTHGVRDFIQRLKERPLDADPLQPFTPFIFTPLELDFEFSCLEGEYDGNGNGEVAIRFMLNLKRVGSHLTSEHIGYTSEVELSDLLKFLDALELELSNCWAKQSLNTNDSEPSVLGQKLAAARVLAL